MRASFLDFPLHVIKDVNIKSDGTTGLLCEIEGLGDAKIVECAFSLQKETSNGVEIEDCTNYLDARMCAPQSNKMISSPGDGTQVYVVRKIKVGTWAKTSLREDATFVLRCVFKASDGRTCAALSSNFQIFSHQSQLPQKKGKSEKSSGRKRTRPIGAPKQETTPPAPVAPMVHLQNGLSPTFAAVKQEEDVFGLHSLSDAALKAASSEEAVAPVSDERLKKKILLERADDLALRIRTLQDEERLLREQAANVASH